MKTTAKSRKSKKFALRYFLYIFDFFDLFDFAVNLPRVRIAAGCVCHAKRNLHRHKWRNLRTIVPGNPQTWETDIERQIRSYLWKRKPQRNP
jgi:hypothetical protein